MTSNSGFPHYIPSTIWVEIQNEILSEYPHYQNLPFFIRMKLKFFGTPLNHIKNFKNERGEFSQKYQTYSYEGKQYFYKFGHS